MKNTTVKSAAELADKLRVITTAVPGLRKAGVVQLELGELKVTIEPPPIEASARAAHGKEPLPDDFLDPKKFRRTDRDEDPDEDLEDDGGES